MPVDASFAPPPWYHRRRRVNPHPHLVHRKSRSIAPPPRALSNARPIRSPPLTKTKARPNSASATTRTPPSPSHSYKTPTKFRGASSRLAPHYPRPSTAQSPTPPPGRRYPPRSAPKRYTRLARDIGDVSSTLRTFLEPLSHLFSAEIVAWSRLTRVVLSQEVSASRRCL